MSVKKELLMPQMEHIIKARHFFLNRKIQQNDLTLDKFSDPFVNYSSINFCLVI